MRVCYLGWFDLDYPRNALLRAGLEAAGVEVVCCQVPPELSPGHVPSPPRGRSARVRHELRVQADAARRAAWLTRRFASVGHVDAIVLAEFNQGLAPLAAALARARRVPLVADFFVSLYDTGVLDRAQLDPGKPRARWRLAVDKATLRLADLVLVDTWQHAEHYRELLGADLGKARLVPIGAPDGYEAVPPRPRGPDDPLDVLYFGSYIPFHGVEHVVAAARLLAGDPRFRFSLVGAGQALPAIRAAYDADPSGNVSFRPPVAQDRVSALITGSDVCLGVFGAHPKAQRVVTNKVWQCLAMGRPVVTAAGPAPREFTRHGLHCLLVPPADPEAIAAALHFLANDPEMASSLAKEAAELVREKYTPGPIGRALRDVLEEAVAARR